MVRATTRVRVSKLLSCLHSRSSGERSTKPFGTGVARIFAGGGGVAFIGVMSF